MIEAELSDRRSLFSRIAEDPREECLEKLTNGMKKSTKVKVEFQAKTRRISELLDASFSIHSLPLKNKQIILPKKRDK